MNLLRPHDNYRKSSMLLPIGGLLTLLLLLAPALPVFAHSGLISAEPAPGETLSSSPDEIRLTFNDPLSDGSTFMLFGRGFQEIDGIASTIDEEVPQQLVASSVPELSPGKYTVQWTVVGPDGDEASGSYSFNVTSRASRTRTIVIIALAAAVAIAAIARGANLLLQRRQS